MTVNRRNFIKSGTLLTGSVLTNSESYGNPGRSPLVNCYYYAPQTHCLLARHVDYDLEKIASLGTDIVTFAVRDDEMTNWNQQRIKNFIDGVHKHGMRVHAVPSSFGELTAGWVVGPSAWVLANPDVWLEGRSAVVDPRNHKWREYAQSVLKFLVEDLGVEGIIWDEPRPMDMREVILFMDDMSAYVKSLNSAVLTSFFAEAGALHMADWLAETQHLDYMGSDGHLRSDDHVMHRMKNTIFKAHGVFYPKLHAAGKKTFFLIEGHRHRNEDLQNYLDNLERAFSLPMDHLMYYYSAHEMTPDKEVIFNRETWKMVARLKQ